MEPYNWSTVTEEKMNPQFSRRVIHTPQMTVAQVWLAPGCIVPVHRHVSQQVTMLKSGSLLYESEAGDRLVLKPGDVLVIPPDLPHRFEALEESTATDVFTPAREDWIRGDDAYLRK